MKIQNNVRVVSVGRAVFEEKACDAWELVRRISFSPKQLLLRSSSEMLTHAEKRFNSLIWVAVKIPMVGRMPESERHVPSNHILRRCGISLIMMPH